MRNFLSFISVLLLIICYGSVGSCSQPEIDGSKLQILSGFAYEINSEKPYSGKVINLYKNGQRSEEITYTDGTINGLYISWYENGEKKIEGSYNDGEKEGLWVAWSENGGKYIEENFSEGEKESEVHWKHGQIEYEIQKGEKNIINHEIGSGSMMPTLLIGEMVHIEKYQNEMPKKGDIIIFKFPEDENRDFMQRVIGIPGDTIKIKNKMVHLNGKPIKESYTIHRDEIVYPSGVQPRDNYGIVVVPHGYYFVLGDNRDFSLDSRFWGFVELRLVEGKAIRISWSEDKSRIGKGIK